MKIWLIFWKTLYIFYAVLLQSGARCHTRLVKPVRLQPHCWLVLWKQLHLPHTNTNVQDEQRQTFSLCRLYASADPALIQQTKLSLLNAQQKSSLAVIMHPPRPAAPQSTVLPAPPTSTNLTLNHSIHYTNCIHRSASTTLGLGPVGPPWIRLCQLIPRLLDWIETCGVLGPGRHLERFVM